MVKFISTKNNAHRNLNTIMSTTLSIDLLSYIMIQKVENIRNGLDFTIILLVSISPFNMIPINEKNAGKLKNKQSYFAFLDLLCYAILSIKIVYKYAKVGGRKHILYVIVLVTYIHIILRVLISPIKSTVHYLLYKCSYELYWCGRRLLFRTQKPIDKFHQSLWWGYTVYDVNIWIMVGI